MYQWFRYWLAFFGICIAWKMLKKLLRFLNNKATVKRTNDRSSQATRTEHPARATNESSIQFSDLPQDILYTIVSKLPPKEFARTRILSRQWRYMWSTMCPRLTFDVVNICNCHRKDVHRHAWKFIDKVDAILQKHQGKVVEKLEFIIDFVDNQLLSDHINNWIDFAVSARTKSLTLDLKPQRFWEYDNMYVFPFQRLDDGGSNMFCLQQMMLSFVSLGSLSPHFNGFPNLRKLHLQIVRVNGKKLQHVLSRCCTNLEWLHLDRCGDLKDELIVDGPLRRLLYLRVEYCSNITKMKFHATNLATFEYHGSFIPIDLTHSLKLQSADIELRKAAFQHALASLLNGFPMVQNLNLNITLPYLEKQLVWDNPLKFYNLRRLQLFMLILSECHDKILYSFSFLRATPFIEELVVHFSGYELWLAEVGPRKEELGPLCKYNYLKNLSFTGFQAARGQLELLLHLVENAPALEVVNINIGLSEQAKKFWQNRGRKLPLEEAKRIVTNCLHPLNFKFNVVV